MKKIIILLVGISVLGCDFIEKNTKFSKKLEPLEELFDRQIEVKLSDQKIELIIDKAIRNEYKAGLLFSEFLKVCEEVKERPQIISFKNGNYNVIRFNQNDLKLFRKYQKNYYETLIAIKQNDLAVVHSNLNSVLNEPNTVVRIDSLLNTLKSQRQFELGFVINPMPGVRYLYFCTAIGDLKFYIGYPLLRDMKICTVKISN
jgi:hypothetical protein